MWKTSSYQQVFPVFINNSQPVETCLPGCIIPRPVYKRLCYVTVFVQNKYYENIAKNLHFVRIHCRPLSSFPADREIFVYSANTSRRISFPAPAEKNNGYGLHPRLYPLKVKNRISQIGTPGLFPQVSFPNSGEYSLCNTNTGGHPCREK